MDPADKLYWAKAAIAVFVGILMTFLQEIAPLSGLSIISLGLLLNFLLAESVGRKLKVDRSKAWKIGIGAYMFTWILVWILTYTLIKS